ncbi:hypothetical protein [Burkholderia multivorans]|uniref:hypothetical protein n=1 Tax=Burkholderia multivorans TaxID=87883 RepID=UPI001C616AA1|nr:hypothetical protein [Burkholderia multivorans]
MKSNINLRDPLAVFRSLKAERPLIVQFIKREVNGRYKGSFLGLFWSFITPLVMLGAVHILTSGPKAQASEAKAR